MKTQLTEVQEKGKLVIIKEIITDKAIKAGLKDRQKKALTYLLGNQYITRSKYVELYGVSLRTANHDLEQLERLGFIRRSGVGMAIKYWLVDM